MPRHGTEEETRVDDQEAGLFASSAARPADLLRRRVENGFATLRGCGG
jgi:hypothetical protein